ncbi:MAG: class I SAM-dependent methyltransferase [Pirellulales bacterium]
MSGLVFDDLTDVYEAMIDWPKRLANEEPFYRRWFARAGARRVADVACGTGHHAQMFNAWNLAVEGSDISPAMIQRARREFGESERLHFVVRGFDRPLAPAEPFDTAVCVGNSLALAPDRETVGRAIREMLSAVRGGGLVIVHVLNLWRLPDGPCLWQKCRRAALPEGEVLIVKGVHRSADHGYVELIVASLGEVPTIRSDSVPFLGLEAEELEGMAREAGAAEASFFGGYADEPYDREKSVDLVMVATKTE